LAAGTPSPQAALPVYEQAVAAGERAAGAAAFREGVGYFWGLMETRPYMRARQSLAFALWMAGRREEAVGHLQDMLRLNPSDNQGLRFTLADWFLALDRDGDADRLVAQFAQDGTAMWAYTRALLAFRREGDTPATRQLLQVARKRNKHVPDYLLGARPVPPEPPDSYMLGDVSEAIVYVRTGLSAWKETAGAVDWLRETIRAGRKGQPEGPPSRGPLPTVQARLGALPQGPDIWQAGARRLVAWIRSSTGPVRPWITLVVNVSQGLILAQQISEDRPTADFVYDRLAEAMNRPLAGGRGRPAEVQFPADADLDALRAPLEAIGVRWAAANDLQPFGEIVADLGHHLGEDDLPGLLDVPGVTPERVAYFFEAAAGFYEQAPWRRLGYESAIAITCDGIRGGPWYAVVMGRCGRTMGLTLYDDLGVLRRLWSGGLSEEENARLTVATTVTFGEAYEIPLKDLEAAERHGWKVARPDAYPHAFRKQRGTSTHQPTRSELDLLEACLRAVPDFVQRRHQDDQTPETITARAGEEEVTLRLSWSEGE
jgi:hypothetical protein